MGPTTDEDTVSPARSRCSGAVARATTPVGTLTRLVVRDVKAHLVNVSPQLRVTGGEADDEDIFDLACT